jgi:UDPglucose 6-dehydrogenase
VFNRSNKPIIVTDPETAEMIKYASNAFLATKITFINEISNLCEKVGANVLDVAKAMGTDGRISPKFLHPGPGYGGSCFPKDTKALVEIGRQYGAQQTIVENVILANQRQKEFAVQKIIDQMPEGGTVAILGLAFKPETDDIRESPAITVIRKLTTSKKFKMRLYDPQAMENMRKELSGVENLFWANDVYEAIREADAIAVITEWTEFRGIDFERVKNEMKARLVFDFRNIFNAEELGEAGFVHIRTGN